MNLRLNGLTIQPSLITKALKTALYCGFYSGLTWSSSVMAKENDDKAKPSLSNKDMEVIEVRGTRYAEQLAISAKRASDHVMDSMSQDDLGQLSDNNLGESLGRIAGLSTILDEGVGRYVSVRGLSPEFVNVSVDGSSFTSATRTFDPGAGRATNMEAVDSDFVGRIDVYKSASADMDGDAIAGSINFVSRSAFDLKEQQSTFSVFEVALGRNSSTDAPFSNNDENYRIKANHITQFGRNNEYGLVLTGNYKKSDKDVIKQGIHYWGSGAKEAVLTPNGVWDTLIHEQGDKKGGSAKLEYQPSDNVVGFISAIYFDEDQTWKNGSHQYWQSGSINTDTATIEEWAGFLSHKNSNFGTKGNTLSTGADWLVWGDRHEFSFRASHSTSSSYLTEPRVKWLAGWKALNGTYTQENRQFHIDLDSESDAIFDDPAHYGINEFRNKRNRADTVNDSVRLDWQFDFEQGDAAWQLKAGLKRKEKTYAFTEQFIRASKYKGDDQFTQYINSYDYMPTATSNPLLFGNVDGLLYQLGSDSQQLDTFILDNFKKFKSNYDNGHDLSTGENVNAAYFMASYDLESVKVRAGLRYEQTDWNGQNRLNNEQDGKLVEHKGEYSDLLPSADFTYQINQDMVIRAAYSQALGRPAIDQYAAKQTTPNETTGVYYRSNADLKPRHSSNLDISYEYYLDEGRSLFSVGVFSKAIENEIFEQRVDYRFSANDQVIDSFYIQPTNAGEGQVRGIESNLILTSLDFLPELFSKVSVNLNATVQKGELELLDQDGSTLRKLDRLTQTPERVFNLSLLYQDDAFDARLAYQYQGERTIQVGSGAQASTADDLVRLSSKRIDFHLGYQINAHLSAYFDVWNVTNERTRDQGNQFWDETTLFGRAYWLGLKAKF